MPRRGSLRDRRPKRSARRRFYQQPTFSFRTYLASVFSDWLSFNGIFFGTMLHCIVHTYIDIYNRSASRSHSNTSDAFMFLILNIPYGVATTTALLITWNMLLETVDCSLNLILAGGDALLPKMPYFLRGVLKLIMNVVLAVMMMVYCVLQLVLLVRPKREMSDADLLNHLEDIDDIDDIIEVPKIPKRFQGKRQKNSSKFNKSSRKQKVEKSLVKASEPLSKENISVPLSWQSEAEAEEILNFMNTFQDHKEFLEETGKLFTENQLYKTKLDVEKDRLICTVCHEEERTLVILPCMHFFMCKSCSEKLSLIGRKCPYCDRTAEDVKEIFVV